IFENDLFDTFPNISIALRIVLTLLISVASGERSFSKLRLIKIFLRSSMNQERLNNLVLISIESELCQKLNTDQITLQHLKQGKCLSYTFYKKIGASYSIF
ncbi:unnamed protein product, partial [Callosobruchus maculatus]